MLVTSVVEAEPDNRQDSPEPSIWPLLAALATTVLFIGIDLHAVGAGLGRDPGRDRPDRLVLAQAAASRGGGAGMIRTRVVGDLSDLPA